MASDLGKSRGLLISEMKPKNATCATVRVSKFIGAMCLEGRTVGKDNVGHSQEAILERDLRGDIVLDIVWGLNTDRNHGNNSRNNDRDASWSKISDCSNHKSTSEPYKQMTSSTLCSSCAEEHR